VENPSSINTYNYYSIDQILEENVYTTGGNCITITFENKSNKSLIYSIVKDDNTIQRKFSLQAGEKRRLISNEYAIWIIKAENVADQYFTTTYIPSKSENYENVKEFRVLVNSS